MKHEDFDKNDSIFVEKYSNIWTRPKLCSPSALHLFPHRLHSSSLACRQAKIGNHMIFSVTPGIISDMQVEKRKTRGRGEGKQ